MLKKILFQTTIGILGFWLATKFITGVSFSGTLTELVLVGFSFSLINSFLKPLLNLITFPLKIITLGLFGIFLNVFFIWLIDLLFANLVIAGFLPLILTTLILWSLSQLGSFIIKL